MPSSRRSSTGTRMACRRTRRMARHHGQAQGHRPAEAGAGRAGQAGPGGRHRIQYRGHPVGPGDSGRSRIRPANTQLSQGMIHNQRIRWPARRFPRLVP